MEYETAVKRKRLYRDIVTNRGGIMRVFIIPELLDDFIRYFKDRLTRDFDDDKVKPYSSNGQFSLYYRVLKAD